MGKRRTKFNRANKCLLCGEKLKVVGEIKVTDNCHLTGKHRKAAHQSSKINVK